MKKNNNLKSLLFYLFIVSSINVFSQMEVRMDNIEYLNNEYDDCETINLNAFNNNDILFDAYVRVPHNTGAGGYVYTYGTLTVWYFSGSTAVPLQDYGINDTHWTYTNSYAYLDIPTINISLDYSLFDDTEGGSIYIVYHESTQEFIQDSCENDITFPKFSISPEYVNLNCGDDSEITFNVENENNTPGDLIYLWDVGNGWEDTNGNSVSYFTTTINSITLKPVSFPPSDVKVEPEVINGENFQQITSSVNTSEFNPLYEIIGDNYVCDTGVYTFNNLPSGIFIQSVSTSNPSVATVSIDSNGEITITKVSDGIVTLSVVLQNSCNQTATKTKELQIGFPASVFNATITGNDDVCQGQNYTYTLSGANHPCVNSIVWSVTSNLNIVSQSANTITVSKNPFDNQYAGEITASIPGSTVNVKKGVWVGTPSNGGLTIQKLGAYDFYVDRWTQLKANYAPLAYASNSPLNVTFDWQIPNSQIRNFTDTAYKDVKPYSQGQLTIGVRTICECGNGQWRYRTFQVDGDSSGGGGELTPVDGN